MSRHAAREEAAGHTPEARAAQQQRTPASTETEASAGKRETSLSLLTCRSERPARATRRGAGGGSPKNWQESHAAKHSPRSFKGLPLAALWQPTSEARSASRVRQTPAAPTGGGVRRNPPQRTPRSAAQAAATPVRALEGQPSRCAKRLSLHKKNESAKYDFVPACAMSAQGGESYGGILGSRLRIPLHNVLLQGCSLAEGKQR